MTSRLAALFNKSEPYKDDPAQNGEQDIPLLQTNGRRDSLNEELLPLPTITHHRTARRHTCICVGLLGILAAGAIGVGTGFLFFGRPSPEPIPELPSPTQLDNSTIPSETPAHAAVTSFLDKQSKTLAEAAAKFTLRNGRTPPPGYDRWFNYAKANKCLIDEYDQIRRDFEPFYQLEAASPGYFNKMVTKVTDFVQEGIDGGPGMKTAEIRGGNVTLTDGNWAYYNTEWQKTFETFSKELPDMNLVLNGRDEPRVVFDYRVPGSLEKALTTVDPTPFQVDLPSPPTFYAEQNCSISNKPTGFAKSVNDVNNFMIHPSSTDYTTDLYPMMSASRVSPCFADILVPSEFYYSYFHLYPHYKYPDNVAWFNKKEKAYWRGMNTGGTLTDETYHQFPRFRLLDIGRDNKDVLDVAITSFHPNYCPAEVCNQDKIIKEYGITGKGDPREHQYTFKYLFDIDGNAFSGRFLGLLTSGSLVFKMTVFSEFFNDWIIPYVHYIPVLPDLSDLVEKIKWAKENDEEAKRIQENGMAFASRIMTDAQNDCYFFLVMLEWANLQTLSERTRDGPGT